MRARGWMTIGLIGAVPLTVVADPGDVVGGYGTDGRVPIEAVSSNVGVGEVRAAHDGRVALTFAGDPESGTAVLVSPDGDTVTDLGLGGPGTAAFGPVGSLYVAADTPDGVTVTRYRRDGSPDRGFGTGGRAELEVAAGVHGDLAVDDGIVVVGGILGADHHAAWASRLDPAGSVDTAFGDDGVVTLLAAEGMAADLVLATDVHPTPLGYVAVVLTRSVAGDSVTVVGFDAAGVARSTELAYPDEVVSAASVAREDGSVLVGVQTTIGDVDTFHLTRFSPDGTPDPSFTDPGLTADEVGGPIHLARLRTGEAALAYNVGPDADFVVRLVGPDGVDLGMLQTHLHTWMYGMATLSHDGSLVLAVDETPLNSVEPDDLTLVKVTGDESGRFVDDDHSVHEADIEELARRAITRGCDPPANTRFCPDDPVTRGQMAAFLGRALDLAPATGDAFTDDDGSLFEGYIDRLAAAGITRGCDPPANTRFCPDDPVTRGQLAAFLARALGLPPAGEDAFSDDDGSVFEGDIDRLAAAGITRGCDPPANTRFCPDDLVTRAEMASLLVRALPDG